MVARPLLGSVWLYEYRLPQRACDRGYKLDSVILITTDEGDNRYEIIHMYCKQIDIVQRMQ